MEEGRARATATSATGPIKVWLSNNPEEIAWGKAMVADWNNAHADQKVTAQEIPAGKTSEEVIGAAITAGNAPCLVFNTSPAAVPQFQKQGGLVALDGFKGAADYIKARSGASADQYKSPDGKFYQIPWKQNPVMIFYNKDLFKKAGLDPDKPTLVDVRRLPRRQQEDRGQRRRRVRHRAGADERVLPVLVRLLPAVRRAVRRQADDRERQGDLQRRRTARTSGTSGRRCTRTATPRKEAYNGDSFADKKAAMAVVGPWAISVYKGKVNWGVVPVPTKDGMSASQMHTFTDAKNIGLYSACKNQKTAWDVLKFATSKDQDGKLLETTGQMPIRTDLPTTYAGLLQGQPGLQALRRPGARAPSRCPTCRTRWRSGRRSATTTRPR